MSATVTLNAPAPAGGAPVNFHAGSEILCPGSLSIPEGSTSQTFTFFTQGVDTDTAVPFGVSRENQEVDTGVLIQQASIVSVTPLASSVQGGAQDTCVITLSGNAGPSAYTPTVSSSDTDVIPNPTGVQLDPQTSQGAFRVNTNPVSTSTDVTLTVNDLIDYRTATITVTPAGPSFFSLAPDSVVGGQNLLATLALTGVSPTGGTSVSFSSVNNVIPASSGTVPAGESYAYIQLPTAAVTNSLNVLVTATVNGASLSSTVTVLPFQLSNATLQTPSVTCGNGELGEVYLTLPAPSQGVTVSLFSNDPAVQVPATVRILPGDLGVLFLVQTSLVNTQKTVTIKARVRTSVPGPTGVQTVTVVLQVNPII
jgi:hypothetical protein